METEDRDSEEAEKPNIITFDPSLPTSHAVSNATTFFSSRNVSVCFFNQPASPAQCCQRAAACSWSCSDSDPCVLTVSGLRHGGVPRSYSPRWRQLPDHPRAATHVCDAGAGSDAASAAVQAAGGQHDEERHPERPHLCCARTQVVTADWTELKHREGISLDVHLS